jgi:cell wall-associated NlpC family hydrolase
MGDFKKIDEKEIQFGDIILIKIFGVDSHIGVYLGEDRMLHTTLHSGCVIERVLRWKHLISGYYRVEKNDSSS